jgi:hypothetical protein
MKRAMELLSVAFVMIVAGSAQAAVVLWYNGDADGKSTIANQVVALSQPGSLPFDDFNVTGQIFFLQSLASNNTIDDLSKMTGKARWEIRTGVTASSAGSIVDRGVGPASFTPTGRTVGGVTEYTVAVSGLALNITPNPYWLSVAPESSDTKVHSFLTSTSGANAIGSPPGNNGNAFSINVSANTVAAISGDYSMNINGLLPTVIPEPSSMALAGLASALFGGAMWRRRRVVGETPV